MAKTEKMSSLGASLRDGLREAAAWKRGEVALGSVEVKLTLPERTRAIRRKVFRREPAVFIVAESLVTSLPP